jgi:hypothetical protein
VALTPTETKGSYDATTFTAGFALSANNTTVSNCPTPVAGSAQTTGCGSVGTSAATNPTSTTLSASASGTTATFNNPFSSVTYYYQRTPGADYIKIGTSTTATVSDNGTANGRTWTYAFTWDPPVVDQYGNVLAPQFGAASPTVNVIAVGVNANGDGVVTSPVTLTFTNP